MDYILVFEQISMADVAKVGGKNAALGEMINYLTKLGIKVPGGFALTTKAYYEFLKYNHCDEIIEENLKTLNVSNLQQLQNCSLNIQNAILRGHIPEFISTEITAAYENLKNQTHVNHVAVRSSATAEDMPEASFAGQQETYLNICGIDDIVEATKQVYASLFSERAISYRYKHDACLKFSELSVAIQEKIKDRTKAYDSPIEFYVEKLTEGIATIAAAFYPKSVIIRFSDFKSNEYANLLGGEQFEPHEENPMLGFRGGSRYLSPSFSDCFSLECEAVKRVCNKLGLSNVHVMLPFVRTVDETKALIALLKKNGLERGSNHLKIYLMCEIPANIILAQDFLQYVDGYSIGSNDLTQLTLGLDRDSELVANLFDERNPAILNLLEQVITICKQQNKYIGICGQGPSDHPDFAKWLMEKGISSISLSPDSVISTWILLAKHL